MGWFKQKKIKKEDPPEYTYYGDKNPSISAQVAVLINDPKFVSLERTSTNTFKITIRKWRGSSMSNICYSETLERVMKWTAVELQGDKHAINRK